MMIRNIKRTAAGLAALAICTGAAMSASQDDTIATQSGALQIHAIHHASLMLTWSGKHVLIDPAPVGGDDPTAGYAALPKPDLIVYTHSHGDHFNVAILEAVAGSGTQIIAPQEVYDEIPAKLRAQTTVMANGDKAMVNGIPEEAEPMYNTTPERAKFHSKGKGNGYILTFGGTRVYIAGDTEEAPELAHLPQIDVAFLPMNLPYTETVEAAAQWVRDLRPKVVYPYHFRNADKTMSDLDAFKKDVGGVSDVRVLDWY